MKIPKIFHQIWFDFKQGNGAEFPEKFKTYRDSWTNQHPDWEYKLWSEDEFLKILPDNLQALYHKYDVMIKKVDFAKFVVLQKYGGVYVDTDEECFKNIEPLMADYDVVLAFDYPVERLTPDMSIINSFMATVPDHPLFAYVINCCPAHQHRWVCHATGPTFFGGRIYEYVTDENNSEIVGNIKIYMGTDVKFFYPISWAKPSLVKKYRHNRELLMKDYPDAYKTSHWSSLWDGQTVAEF